MNKFILTYLSLFFTLSTFSQTERKIADLEDYKQQLNFQIEDLRDSIARINLQIAKIKSEKFRNKIQDSSLTAIARKGAKLKKDSSVFADIITIFNEDKKVIIIDYIDGYYEICQGSLCGYMSEIWLLRNNSISEFAKSKNANNKYTARSSSSTNYSSSLKSKKSSKPTYNKKSYRTSRTYYRGPRGGCYYINSNGNKTYVARSLCN